MGAEPRIQLAHEVAGLGGRQSNRGSSRSCRSSRGDRRRADPRIAKHVRHRRQAVACARQSRAGAGLGRSTSTELGRSAGSVAGGLRGEAALTGIESALDLGLSIARTLERHRVPYALGGALAYGIYGNPRNTNDVDVNVFLRPTELAPAFAAFRELGIGVDEGAAVAAAASEGLFVLRFHGMRVDVFTPSIDFSWEALRTRVSRDVEGQVVWFLSPEALAVFKMLFFRPKDLVDLERLLATSGDRMDSGYVRSQLVAMMGADDERVTRWDQLVRDHAPK
jgi:hypothetical protein